MKGACINGIVFLEIKLDMRGQVKHVGGVEDVLCLMRVPKAWLVYRQHRNAR